MDINTIQKKSFTVQELQELSFKLRLLNIKHLFVDKEQKFELANKTYKKYRISYLIMTENNTDIIMYIPVESQFIYDVHEKTKKIGVNYDISMLEFYRDDNDYRIEVQKTSLHTILFEHFGIKMHDNSSLTLKIIGGEGLETCSGLLCYFKGKKVDLNDFRPLKCEDFECLFSDSKIQILESAEMRTDNALTMKGMFNNSTIEYFQTPKWNTSKVVNMERMFYSSTFLTECDLSKLDTSNVKSVDFMFAYCTIRNLNLSNFNISGMRESAREIQHIFYKSNLSTNSNLVSSDSSFNQYMKDVAEDISNYAIDYRMYTKHNNNKEGQPWEEMLFYQ